MVLIFRLTGSVPAKPVGLVLLFDHLGQLPSFMHCLRRETGQQEHMDSSKSIRLQTDQETVFTEGKGKSLVAAHQHSFKTFSNEL